jgi:hypothetical protein
MSNLTKATLVIEHVFQFPGGTRPAVRVIPHDDEGNKPRGKAGKGTLIVANEGETWPDVLRTVAGYYEQEGSWDAFAEVMP